MQLKDQHLLLQNDVLTTNLVNCGQDQKVGVNENLAHRGKLGQNGWGLVLLLQLESLVGVVDREQTRFLSQELDSLSEGFSVESVIQDVLRPEDIR